MTLTEEQLDQEETPTPEQPPANLYNSVYAFVHDWLVSVYCHEVNDMQSSWRWCSLWHHHPEAVARLEAAWKAFEVLRQDPGTGASVWFRDHGDPCMAVLTAADGPFRACSNTSHRRQPNLPYEHLTNWEM